MRTDIPKLRLLSIFFDEIPESSLGELCVSFLRTKERGCILSVRLGEERVIRFERNTCCCIKGNFTVLIPFAMHKNTPASLSQANLGTRSEEHTSELQSHLNLVCRLLL